MPRSTDARRIRPGPAGRVRLPRPERPVRHRHHLHPGARRHDDALGGQDPAHAARGLRDAHAASARAGTGRSATTTSSRTTRRPSASSASRPTSRTRRSSAITFEPGLRLPDARAAAVLPRQDGGARASTARTSSSDGEQLRAAGPAFPQARNGIPNPAYDGGKGFIPVGRGEHAPGRGGRPLPGQHQLRADLPGPGQVQRRQDAVEGAADAAASTCWPRPSPPRCTSTPRPAGSAAIEYKAYGDPNSPRAHDRHRAGTDLRARRQRDRERPADAGLRPAQHRAGWSGAT